MPKFTDAQGQDWLLAINVQTIKRVRTECDGLDLLGLADAVVERLMNDPVLLCDVLFVICERQAEMLDISSEQFGERLAGDAIEQATAAFVEALIDFFPHARRAAFRKAVGKIRELQQKQTDLTLAWLDGPELTKRLEQMVKEPELPPELSGLGNPLPSFKGGSASM